MTMIGVTPEQFLEKIEKLETQLKKKDEQIKELEEEATGSYEAMNILASSVRGKDEQIESHRECLSQFGKYDFERMKQELSKEFK